MYVGSAPYMHFQLKVFPSKACLQLIYTFSPSSSMPLHKKLCKILPKTSSFSSSIILFQENTFISSREYLYFCIKETLEANFVKTSRFAYQVTHCMTDCPCHISFLPTTNTCLPYVIFEYKCHEGGTWVSLESDILSKFWTFACWKKKKCDWKIMRWEYFMLTSEHKGDDCLFSIYAEGTL